jgi:Ca2+-binding EF-hand superfamily protein
MNRAQLVGVVMTTMLSSMVALSQDPPPTFPPPGQGMRMQMPSFRDLDRNKDGKITRDEFQGPEEFFNRLDANGDGALSEEEFQAARQRFQGQGGPRLGESLVTLLDANRDGKVSRDEFAKIVEVFTTLDRDADGSLTGDELARLPSAASAPASRGETPAARTDAGSSINVNALFERYDTNKDGKLSEEEMKLSARLFQMLDANRDGLVTREEVEKFVKDRETAAKKPE